MELRGEPCAKNTPGLTTRTHARAGTGMRASVVCDREMRRQSRNHGYAARFCPRPQHLTVAARSLPPKNRLTW